LTAITQAMQQQSITGSTITGLPEYTRKKGEHHRETSSQEVHTSGTSSP